MLFATLTNADTWKQIVDFALWNKEYLKKYIELKNGIPSHDTIRRVMGMVRPENLQRLQGKWQEMPNRNEGEKPKKIICVDGKTMLSNKRNGSKPCHIVPTWNHEDGYCMGQKAVDEKSKEGYRYYINSLMEDIELFSRAVRGYWAVENMHWHLDVTFKEDANTTLDKTAAQNQNIIRKWCLGMLKLFEIQETKMSLRRKKFNISFAPAQFIEELMKI